MLLTFQRFALWELVVLPLDGGCMGWQVQDVQRLSSRCTATEFKMYSDCSVTSWKTTAVSILCNHSATSQEWIKTILSVEIDEMTLIPFTEKHILLSQRYLYTVLKVIKWSRAIKSQKLKRWCSRASRLIRPWLKKVRNKLEFELLCQSMTVNVT